MVGRKADPHYGDHIRLSMGHPDLEQLTEQIAKKIRKSASETPRLIPENLMEITNKILDEKIFPVWNSEGGDEQILLQQK